MLKISILTIGDEILIGQTLNTNTQFIAKEITALGAELCYQSVVSDVQEKIHEEISKQFEQSDIVICTGGLGPTTDDLTKDALCTYFNCEMTLHNDTWQFIQQFYESRGRKVKENVINLAYIPNKAKTLKNRVGAAPGLLFEEDGKVLFALPGVPQEMKAIMQDEVLPFIKKYIENNKHKIKFYKSYQTAGITESELAEIIHTLSIDFDEYSLAYLPSYKGVKLRFGVNVDSFDIGNQKMEALAEVLDQHIAKWIISTEEEDLLEIVIKELLRKNLTISVAESCTGGYLGKIFTDVAGSSRFFQGGVISYSNEIKNKLLGVSLETLEKNGAVSQETASEMAAGVRKLCNTDYAISITGIAGPEGGTDEKAVGTVFIAVANNEQIVCKKFLFGKDRNTNRERSVYSAIFMLYELLKILNLRI